MLQYPAILGFDRALMCGDAVEVGTVVVVCVHVADVVGAVVDVVEADMCCGGG